jgi:hypothetical protein
MDLDRPKSLAVPLAHLLGPLSEIRLYTFLRRLSEDCLL